MQNTPLTRREITVLRLVAKGMSAKLIAQNIHVTTRTVHYFYAAIKNKMGVNTMEEVMFIAGRDDLLGEYLPDEEI